MTPTRDMLITTALPYANGDLHLGHLVEHVQADIWVRFQKMQGHRCVFVCGDDAHGTPIMLSAQKHGLSPEAFIQTCHAAHTRDFKAFSIGFDTFYTTHSPENEALSHAIYAALQQNGDIFKKRITQYFDPDKNLFLPDRFIRGTCPRCRAQDQYGDNCEACGATYNPTDLIDPRSDLSGATPVEKDTEHYFFNLENHQQFLEGWINQGHLQPEVANKLKEWFKDSLKPWDITRDAPYFGFLIPGTQDKYFYVWLDAPVGYLASTQHLFANDPERFEHYWKKDSPAELYHFIGKDIVYFHTLFWPAILKASNHRLPTNVFVHGYLTIGGKKMSKSRGTFITAKHYLDTLPPEFLRYYYAAKLTPHVEDIDLNLSDFGLRVNADLIGKYVNLASRSAGFITKRFDGKLSDRLDDPALFETFVETAKDIAKAYDTRHFNKAMRLIMTLADRANQYIDHHKPWALAKTPGNEAKVQAVCTQGLNLFRVLSVCLKPVLPVTAARVETFFNETPFTWASLMSPLLAQGIQPFQPLMQRITEEHINALTDHTHVTSTD